MAGAILALTHCGWGEPWGSSPTEEPPEPKVVGGRSQPDGYPAAGYLVRGGGSTRYRLACGMVLIEPDVALTAAHCIDSADYQVGFGRVDGGIDLGDLHRARAVVVHAGFDNDDGNDHDVAVVVLERPVDGVQPARIAAAAEGCGYRYVGYGRTTAGDQELETGYTFERKSTAVCVDDADSLSLDATGEGGGLCLGDSGGPLFAEGSSDVVGVAAALAGGLGSLFFGVSCEEGGSAIFTSLAAERPMIECAIARGRSVPAGSGTSILRVDGRCEAGSGSGDDGDGDSDEIDFPDACGGSRSCEECAALAGCGWCGTTGRCEAGTPDGPEGGPCAVWSWYPSECGGDDGGDDGGSDDPDPEPTGSCGDQSICSDCVQLPDCGWCNTTWECVEGSSWGPDDGSCDWLDWAWSSDGSYCAAA